MSQDVETIEILHQGKFLELRKQGRWEYVRRLNANGSVHVLAITPEREIVLVEQVRVPVHQRTIELPAGVVGDESEFRNETAIACALRELVEETGYQAEAAEVIQVAPSAPGLCSEIQHIVRATGLRQVGRGGGVDGENITVHRIALDEVHQWLLRQQRAGLMVDFRIYAALYFAGAAAG